MSVNEERVRLLVDALRSGQRVQGRMVLEAKYADGTVKNCCLGVACRVAMESGLPVKITRMGGVDGEMFEDGDEIVLFDGQEGDLPASVQHWYGFGDANPLLSTATGTGRSGALRATAMNDAYEMPFDMIADAFERTYLT